MDLGIQEGGSKGWLYKHIFVSNLKLFLGKKGKTTNVLLVISFLWEGCYYSFFQ